jgi:GH43 family beta-xylosidase
MRSLALLALVCSLAAAPSIAAAPTGVNGADPSIIRLGSLYVASQTGNNGIIVRTAATLADLASDKAKVTQVWHDDDGLNEVWAPEIVMHDAQYRIYFAAGKGAAHRMYEIHSANPDTGYSAATQLALPGDTFAIDGVAFFYKQQRYFVWSGWGDNDSEQNLYIARMSDATTADGNRYIISQPRETWERVVGDPYINEAPEPIIDPEGRLHIVYSANGSWEANYCVADLRLRDGGNPLYVWDWYKSNGCVFGSDASELMTGWHATEHVQGPGHPSFILTGGDIVNSPPAFARFPIAYHAVAKGTKYAWDKRQWFTGEAVWWGDTTYSRANSPGPATDKGASLKMFE